MVTPLREITYCYPDQPDQMLLSQLFIMATRTHIHVHEQSPCSRCLQDVMVLGQHGFALLSLINRLKEQLDAAQAPAVEPVPGDYRDGDEVVVTITGVTVDGIGDHHTWLACEGLAEGIELPWVDDDGKPLANVRITKAGCDPR